MKRMKNAGLNGLLAAAAITLAGCVPPGANTSASTATLEHCSDFHYPQPLGVEQPVKATINPAAYDLFGPRVWSTGTGAHRLECVCIQNMNFANSSKEYLRETVNNGTAEYVGLKINAGDVLSGLGNEAQYEFQGTITKAEYRDIIVLGRAIGAGSCLFGAFSVIPPNPSSEYLKSEWIWLRSISFGKQPKPSSDSASSLSVSDRLKALDELQDQHRISDDEYRSQRARILNGI
jgi:hypothetical protein